MTLYGKALDNRVERPILGDKFADEAVKRIDYDFARLGFEKGGHITLPMRAKHLDGWAREFIAANPVSTVLHLGCGLDTRVFRIDPPASVLWYDVDYPDVIELRKRLYPERQNYTMISSSVTDLKWLEVIPSDRPVLVVAEGLVMYLSEDAALALFRRITEKFPAGEFVFDAYSRLMTRLISLVPAVRASGITLAWGISDPVELEKQVPDLKLVDSVSFLTMPELVDRLSESRFQRVMSGLMGRLGFYQRLIRHLRYRF